MMMANKRHKTLIIFLFTFCLLISFVQAENLLLSDDFSYSDAFASHGWQYSGAGCDPSIPVNGSFGLNTSDTGCNFAYSRFIRRDVESFTNSTLNITWAYFDDTDSISASNRLTIRTSKTNATITDYFEVTFDKDGMINFSSSFAGFTKCVVSSSSSGYHYYNLILDFPNKKYYFYIDNLIKCSGNKIGNTILGMQGFHILQGADTHENIVQLVDYIILTNQTSENLLPENTPCGSNEECDSGYCLNGLCALKNAYMQCDDNNECASGECVNGFCSRDTLSSSLTRAKNQLAGSDEASSNIVSFVIMLIVAFGSAALTFGLGLLVMGFVFIAVFLLSGFIFAFIGWLSGWVIFGMIFVILMAIIAMIFLKGGGGSGN